MVLQFDASFIQEFPHRSKATTQEADNIPTIDLSPMLTSGDHIPDALVREVEDACKAWGFFHVINHGVPPEVLENLHSLAKEFFDLPIDEKRKTKRDEENSLGYHDGENTKNTRDWKEVVDIAVTEPMYLPAMAESGETRLLEIWNKWPEYPPELRKACQEYQKALTGLQYKILELISLSLGLPAKRLNGYFTDTSTTFIRLNHYPPCPNPELALGVGHHTDSGAFTILAQDDVGGLEVRRQSDKEWVRVKPIPNSYVVNIGDIMQVWSNDKYGSAEHRVTVNSNKERFSIPFFVMPAHYTMVKPLEELVNKETPPKYLEYNWGEFLRQRKTGDYKKMEVENLQIYHFTKAE